MLIAKLLGALFFSFSVELRPKMTVFDSPTSPPPPAPEMLLPAGERMARVVSLASAVTPAEFRSDPWYAVTQGRGAGAGYSSCGDLAHYCLFYIGARDPRLVNRDEPALGLRWQVGRNIAKLRDGGRVRDGWTEVVGKRWHLSSGSETSVLLVCDFPSTGELAFVAPGSILLAGVPGIASTEHVMVVLSVKLPPPFEVSHDCVAMLETAEFGQLDAERRQCGKRRSRTLWLTAEGTLLFGTPPGPGAPVYGRPLWGILNADELEGEP